MDQELRETLERLRQGPLVAGGETRGERRPPESARFTIAALDSLLERAYSLGEENGYGIARAEHEAIVGNLRPGLVDATTGVMLQWLGPIVEELEGALMQPVVSPAEAKERPDDEFVDDRAERLEAALNGLRDTFAAIARDAGLEKLIPDDLTTGQVELWREVHPVEPVEEFRAIPARALSNVQLAAVLDNDEEAFASAGRVVVPEALAELRRRATLDVDDFAPNDVDNPVAAKLLLENREIPLEPEPSA